MVQTSSNALMQPREITTLDDCFAEARSTYRVVPAGNYLER